MATLGTFTAGQVLTAAELNGIATTSTTYTPTWTSTGTQPTLGNATLTGRYIQINKLVWVQILFVFGSTSAAGTGTYRFSLPSGLTARSGLYGFMSQGVARLYNSDVGQISIGHAGFDSGQTTTVMAYAGVGQVGATAPFTFATNDEIVMTFWYEAA